jgi:cyclohexyl-isocyanide hydratase
MRISMVLFDRLTQLDLTGPYEVLSQMDGVEIALVAKSMDPVTSDSGLRILPTHTFADAPPHDVIFVPGGPGVNEAMLDDDVLAFVRRPATYITSVCTGALVLGAAGLLQSYEATTHWNSAQFLPLLGACHVDERVVIDRNRITGAGVSSGIDFAIALVAHLQGDEAAKEIQLGIEYDPQPPFDDGSPRTAEPQVVAAVRAEAAPMIERRRKAVEEAARRLR